MTKNTYHKIEDLVTAPARIETGVSSELSDYVYVNLNSGIDIRGVLVFWPVRDEIDND
jgi:hypothetical protein